MRNRAKRGSRARFVRCHKPVDPAVAAGVAGRADDHRHAEPPRPQQHVLEIMPLPLHRARREIRAERPRTDIARPRICADQIMRAIEPDPKARRLDRRKPEMPVGARPGRWHVPQSLNRREFLELRPPYRSRAIFGMPQAMELFVFSEWPTPRLAPPGYVAYGWNSAVRYGSPECLGCADSGRSRDGDRSVQVDPTRP